MSAPPVSAPGPRRSPQLIALQTVATIFLAQAIGQAGLAAAFLTKHHGYKEIHGINGMAMAAMSVIMLVVAIVYRRSGGPRWTVTAALVLVLGVLATRSTSGEVARVVSTRSGAAAGPLRFLIQAVGYLLVAIAVLDVVGVIAT